MEDRLIEVGFPLKQASLDSVHEKNVRHGHISTLHIWPARRPLAASRAALITTLLPDPGTPDERKRTLEKLGGSLVEVQKTKKLPSGKVEVTITEETRGGVLHWGQEANPEIEWFRDKIKETYGGHPPKVLDPFSGGGAIPLEAMRLGCEVTAVDINPVAWLVLKCTLEYPQRLAGQTRPFPQFALDSAAFMAYFKSTGKKVAKRQKSDGQEVQSQMFDAPSVGLAWHVRVWGWWTLQRAISDLGEYYPIVGEQPTVAYLWTRTVKCKHCRAIVPLLKTRWLCKRGAKRVLLTMESNPDKTGVVFGIQTNVPVIGGNSAQSREHDKRVGAGTMSRSGASCPCCGAIMTMGDIRLEGKAGRIGATMTAVVVDGRSGREYRLPVHEEIARAQEASYKLEEVFADIPFGIPMEPLPPKEALGFRVPLYGFDEWGKLFTPRQLLALGTFVKHIRVAKHEMQKAGYSTDWIEAISSYLALSVDRIADAGSSLAHWQMGNEFSVNTFQRFALPMSWDFAEVNVTSGLTGSYQGALAWIGLAIEHFTNATK